MLRSLHRAGLQVFRILPPRLRRTIVRTVQPKYTVGSICVVERADGRVLLVRHTYRKRWGTPGGLADRREHPDAAAVREAQEEVGLAIELVGEPAVVVEPAYQRVDVVYRARPAYGADPDAVRPSSAEIAEVAWFPADAMPELQAETATAIVALARQARAVQSTGSQRRPPA